MNQNLKVLCIGNSFSDDMCVWAYDTAVGMGIEGMTIVNAMVPGCSIATHLYNSRDNSKKYMRQETKNGDTVNTEASLEELVTEQDWDIITLQQASHYSGFDETYKANLTELIKYVKSKATNPNLKIYWHFTWSYDDGSTHKVFYWYKNDSAFMYKSILDTVKWEIVPNKDFAGIIKSGPLFETMRARGIKQMTRDGFHASLNFGRQLLALNFVSTITGVSPDVATFKAPGVTDEQLDLIKEVIKEVNSKEL